MHRFKRPSPSMAVALLALTVALGGTATAATVLVRSSSQIKDGAVKRADIAPSAINSGRVQDGSLKLNDLSDSAQGVVGSAGLQGLEAVRAGGPENVGPGQTATVATLRNIPQGAYAIFAKTVLTAPGNEGGILSTGGSVGGHCVLDADGDTDESFALLGSPGALAPAELSLQITRTFAEPSDVKLVCDVTQETWRGSNTSIIALPLGSAPRQNVDG